MPSVYIDTYEQERQRYLLQTSELVVLCKILYIAIIYFLINNCRALLPAAAHHRNQNDNDPTTYCRIPKVSRNGVVWAEIEFATLDPAKGTGIVARIDLPKDLCIPYGGVYRNQQEVETQVRHCNDGMQHRLSHSASVECLNKEGIKEKGMMDAHPKIMKNRGVPPGAWPGGYCNQADFPETQNADILQYYGTCEAPKYEWMDEQCHNLFVKLRRPVRAGEEVLVDYGYSASRQTRWGFGFKAKRVKLNSEYTFRPRTKTEKYGVTRIIG